MPYLMSNMNERSILYIFWSSIYSVAKKPQYLRSSVAWSRTCLHLKLLALGHHASNLMLAVVEVKLLP